MVGLRGTLTHGLRELTHTARFQERHTLAEDQFTYANTLRTAYASLRKPHEIEREYQARV